MRKIKLLSVLTITLVIATVSVYMINFNRTNKPQGTEPSTEKTIKYNFSEELFSDEKLKQVSDLIVRAKVKGLKEKATKKVSTTSNNEKVDITAPIEIYEVDVLEGIKNNEKPPKSIDLVIPASSITIETGKEYMLSLYKIKGESSLTGSYGLTSFSQGIYKLDESNQELVSVKTKQKIKKDDFIAKFKD
ncbi:hypothetical protein [Pseudobacteroides cellulosolvens]|uniref:Uncharacterized protein n=1 Tax=Pseudobacteroides cellulosolvens ATCC 35603 = DSM 2933 TaxID=398512 RepID=A0A0L6JYK6_9FIRM|nr:hypothetical protein [Pseudobacteroides cellulosolvens]KNY30600.1 hypothetical protein Bccel_5880 [Pseudobacteroides cellulosolvens ATCC 35603 = DSM 2933]